MGIIRRSLTAATALAALLALPARAAELRVTIHNVKSDQGKVLVALFRDPASFPDKYLAGKQVPAQAGDVAVVFDNVDPGSYAVSAFHDRDGNGKLNRNLVGIPTEPYGFSRNARGRTGPPSFDDAKIDVGAAGAAIAIDLK